MKKHIRKKFIGEVQLGNDVVEYLSTHNTGNLEDSARPKVDQLLKKKDVTPYLTTDTGVFLKGFVLKVGKENKILPEPDPVLIYFDTAYRNYINIAKMKDAIFDKIKDSPPGMMPELLQKELYEFFGTTSSFVILLWTAMEALINRCIPTTYTYNRITPKKTETFTKRQIEEFISFDEKVKTILPEITSKNFHSHYSTKFSVITELKEFRNMIVHTREAEGKATYDYLYKKAFRFDYARTLVAVKDFCNFYYKENFIEECDCSFDW